MSNVLLNPSGNSSFSAPRRLTLSEWKTKYDETLIVIYKLLKIELTPDPNSYILSQDCKDAQENKLAKLFRHAKNNLRSFEHYIEAIESTHFYWHIEVSRLESLKREGKITETQYIAEQKFCQLNLKETPGRESFNNILERLYQRKSLWTKKLEVIEHACLSANLHYILLPPPSSIENIAKWSNRKGHTPISHNKEETAHSSELTNFHNSTTRRKTNSGHFLLKFGRFKRQMEKKEKLPILFPEINRNAIAVNQLAELVVYKRYIKKILNQIAQMLNDLRIIFTDWEQYLAILKSKLDCNKVSVEYHKIEVNAYANEIKSANPENAELIRNKLYNLQETWRKTWLMITGSICRANKILEMDLKSQSSDISATVTALNSLIFLPNGPQTSLGSLEEGQISHPTTIVSPKSISTLSNPQSTFTISNPLDMFTTSNPQSISTLSHPPSVFTKHNPPINIDNATTTDPHYDSSFSSETINLEQSEIESKNESSGPQERPMVTDIRIVGNKKVGIWLEHTFTESTNMPKAEMEIQEQVPTNNSVKSSKNKPTRRKFKKCAYCFNKFHRSSQCCIYKTVSARVTRLKALKLCALCLKKHVNNCPYRKVRYCYRCRQLLHHPSICFLRYHTRSNLNKANSSLHKSECHSDSEIILAKVPKSTTIRKNSATEMSKTLLPNSLPTIKALLLL